MLALGALLTCTALLALARFTIVFRGPEPPRWAAWSGELITVAIVTAFALGLAYLIAGISNAYEQGTGLVDLGLLAAVLVAALAIWRRIDLRGQLRSIAARTPIRGASADPRLAGRAAPPSASAPATEPPSRPTPRAA